MTTCEQFVEINGRLIAARKALEERERVLSLMDVIDGQLSQKYDQRDFLSLILHAEKGDVEKLEGLSITAVLAKLMGQHEQKLEKEVEEYLQAKIELETCRIAVQTLENNHSELEMMLVALAECDDEFAQAEAEQKKFLIQHHQIHPQKVAAIPELIAEKQRFVDEIDEALKIGGMVQEMMADLYLLVANRTGAGRVVLRASAIQSPLDLFQLELEDIATPLLPNADLRIPKFKDVMSDVFISNQQAAQMREMRRKATYKNWIAHLAEMEERVKQKLSVLAKKKAVAEAEIEGLQTEQGNLVQKLWERAENTAVDHD